MNKYNPSLIRLVELAEKRQDFMASLLVIYKRQEELDDQQVAELLECDVENLLHLALCERPRSAPHFWKDVEQIASHLHIDPDRLANLTRLAESIEERYTDQNRTYLLAARDYDEERETDSRGKDAFNE
jgi:hypothetical protein